MPVSGALTFLALASEMLWVVNVKEALYVPLQASFPQTARVKCVTHALHTLDLKHAPPAARHGYNNKQHDDVRNKRG